MSNHRATGGTCLVCGCRVCEEDGRAQCECSTCENCGQPFLGMGERFCSDECEFAAREETCRDCAAYPTKCDGEGDAPRCGGFEERITGEADTRAYQLMAIIFCVLCFVAAIICKLLGY